MYFKNEKHRQAFESGIKKANKKDKETLCLIYLLSADQCLWHRAKQAAGSRIMMLNSIRVTNIKTAILDLRQVAQIHERKKEYKLFIRIIIMN